MSFSEFLKAFNAAYEQGLYSDREAYNILTEWVLTHPSPEETVSEYE